MLIYRDEIESTYERVDEVVREIVNRCKNMEELNIKSFLFKLSVVLRELLNNAVEHGNRFDPDKHIFCEIRYLKPTVEITVVDEGEGIGFDEALLLDEEALTQRSRGFKMLKKMDFEFQIDGSKVLVSYHLEL